MAKIVGVHGVGHQFKGENTLRAEWLPALKDGLVRAKHQLASDEDFLCAFYGDLFRPGGKGAMDPPYDASDVSEEWEREFLELWWREAARVDQTVVGPDARTKVSVPSIVQRALDALSQSPFFAGLAEHALIYDLKQVRRYLREPEVRREAGARVQRAIGSDTRVLVGHSLGSVVAYEALCAHPEWQVNVFVTLGSPLGIRNLIFEALDPAPRSGKGVWPPGIKQWVNIADGGDVVALVKELGPLFGPRVTDRRVDNGAKAHDATRYLTTQEVGDAVAIGL
jgi:pimeloyl-ACP methyl ester carboxylesterase